MKIAFGDYFLRKPAAKTDCCCCCGLLLAWEPSFYLRFDPRFGIPGCLFGLPWLACLGTASSNPWCCGSLLACFLLPCVASGLFFAAVACLPVWFWTLGETLGEPSVKPSVNLLEGLSWAQPELEAEVFCPSLDVWFFTHKYTLNLGSCGN